MMRNPDPFQIGRGDPAEQLRRRQRREAHERVAAFLRQERGRPLLPFEEVQRRLRLFRERYLGVRSVPVEQIVGTVSRKTDFREGFEATAPHLRRRMEQLERAYPEGNFPPIVVYKVGDAHFVVDGHHRVAIARRRGMPIIEAEVTEFESRYELPADADIGRIIHLEQQRLFLEESGLGRSRPEAAIEVSRPHRYWDLLDRITAHGYRLMQERGEAVPVEEAAGDWYDRVYLPTVEAMREHGLLELFPDSTPADLFLWIHERRRLLYPERGTVGLDEAVREAARRPAREPGHGLTMRAREILARLRRS